MTTEEFKKRKKISRLFESWADSLEVEQLNKVINILNYLCKDFDNDK